jgi:predicted acylesterase/phospholipase RssA
MNASIDATDVGRRYCDVVMKGGITSGVVFPAAIARLSTQFRFRNIGGTSAGAIAAAGAAAAEYRRATDNAHPEYGFARLGELGAWLGGRPDGRHSRLYHLFAPEPDVRRHFAVLSAMLNRGTRRGRVLHGLLAAAQRFPLGAIAGALPGIVVVAGAFGTAPANVIAVVVAGVVAVAGALAGGAVAAAVSLCRRLPGHAFGLVNGHRESADANDPPALTDWLHGYLQDIAGKDPASPLTFGDLDRIVFDEPAGIHGINLTMMTTALSMGRPFSLPFDTEQFYFEPDEFARFFPQAVVDWLIANPGERTAENEARDDAMAAFGYLPLPLRETLPVVVAARMSLSFPLLLSGIPLYRYAWESGDIRKVLFSDGGICSNFPVHLFDAVLPGWPTFGINLREDLPADASASARAILPGRGKALPPEDYAIADQGFAAMFTFASTIVRTMQNWRDNLQRAAPGFRDRVVTIRHTKEEGGLNLDMAPADIAAMTASGDLAARRLIEAFATPPDIEHDHFTYHRWVRVRSLLGVSQQVLREIHEGVTVLDNDPPYPDLVRDAPAYVGASYRLPDSARAAAAHLLDALDRLDRELDDAGVDYMGTAPRPPVALRIQPIW